MGYEQDVRDQVLSTLPYASSERPKLEALALGALLILDLNWLSRFIVPQPRAALVSTVLAAKRPLGDEPQERALSAIVRCIEAGGDLMPHLSLQVGSKVKAPSPVRGYRSLRRQLDPMLNDWGVHHLHLSTVNAGNGRVERTGLLLFAAFKPDAAYLIDVVEHGSGYPNAWTSAAVLRIMAREWPQEGIIFAGQGLLSDTLEPSDTDRRTLRASGITTFVNVDGRVFMPRSGITTAGTATDVSIKANYILRHIDELNEGGTAKLAGAFLRAGIAPPSNPNYRFRVYANGYGLIEEMSGQYLELGAW